MGGHPSGQGADHGRDHPPDGGPGADQPLPAQDQPARRSHPGRAAHFRQVHPPERRHLPASEGGDSGHRRSGRLGPHRGAGESVRRHDPGRRYHHPPRKAHPEQESQGCHQERLCPPHRGAPGHRHFRHPGYQGEHRGVQPEGLPPGRLLPQRQEDAGQDRLGHSGHAHQDPHPAHPDPLPVRRQPAEGHHRPLAAHQAGGAAAGRAHPRH